MELHSLRRKRRFGEINMLQGPIFSQLLYFALPMIATQMLNILFNAADVAVVGRFDSGSAMAAVGATTSLINLLINLSNGIGVGAGILMARYIGARDYDHAYRNSHAAAGLALLLGFAAMIVGLVFSTPILKMMDTPVDILEQASLYLRIYFIGVPASIVYTFSAAALRASGDSRHSMYYLTAGGVINLLLNLLLVIVLHMGVAGVAIATVVSKFISVALILRHRLKADDISRLSPKDVHFDLKESWDLFRTGFPIGLQGCLFNLSNVIIQSTINSFGSAVVAGSTAASNVNNLSNAVIDGVYQSSMTFGSQNYGAKNYRRMKKICRTGCGICAMLCIPMGVLITLAGRQLLGIFVSADDPAYAAIIDAGMHRLFWLGLFVCIHGLMNVLSGMVRAAGRTWLPMIVTLTGACALRVVWLNTVFPMQPTLDCLFVSYPITWTITAAAHLLCFLLIMRKLQKTKKEV